VAGVCQPVNGPSDFTTSWELLYCLGNYEALQEGSFRRASNVYSKHTPAHLIFSVQTRSVKMILASAAIFTCCNRFITLQ